MRETWVQSLGREDPWRRKWQPTPVFLPRESYGWRSLVGYISPRVAKSQTRLSDFTFITLSVVWSSQVALVVKKPSANAEDMEMWVWSLGWEDPLEEGVATHCSILAWRIPWTEEPGGLRSIVAKSWAQLKQLSTLTCMHQLFRL